jgi:hypothetical protein
MPLMALTSAALSVLLLAALPPAAIAQSSPAADFDLIQKKAEAIPQLRGYFSRFTQMQQNSGAITMMLDQVNNQIIGRNRTLPFAYRQEADVQIAQARGQVWGQLLSVDLNNDGEITAAELKTTLSFGGRNQVADAFFVSDANNDFVLSHDELRAEVERQVGDSNRFRGGSPTAALFDFDDDGMLTDAEMQRGVAALRYKLP